MITLGELVGYVPPPKPEPEPEPVEHYLCPTGKAAYRSKREASAHLRKMHGHRTRMQPFRCGWCDRYHVGHRRGAVL